MAGEFDGQNLWKFDEQIPKIIVLGKIVSPASKMAICFGYLLVKFWGVCIEKHPMFDRIVVKISRWFSCNF